MFMRRGVRGWVIVIALPLSVNACGAPGMLPGSHAEPLTPAQQQLEDANHRFAQTVGEGAVIGALVGGALGLALGGHNRLEGAAIGAGAGALFGGGAGYAVARKNYQQSQTEANLRKSIDEAHADADAYARSAEASRQITLDARSRIASLDAQYRAKAITLSEYRSKMASFENSESIMNKQIAQMRSEASDLRSDAASAEPSDKRVLIANANQMDSARQTMERNVHSLEAALSEVPGG